MTQLKIEYRAIESLIPYERNSRTHSDEQIAQIVESIKQFGWTNPILVDGENGILAGHGRLAAAHELIYFSTKKPIEFDNHKAIGNVISVKRTGNPLHPTQKPVEIIDKIMEVMGMCDTYYDPFGGSGTTLIASEKAKRAAYLMELSQAFVDVTVLRWQEFTGQQATLVGDGRTYNEIASTPVINERAEPATV